MSHSYHNRISQFNNDHESPCDSVDEIADRLTDSSLIDERREFIAHALTMLLTCARELLPDLLDDSEWVGVVYPDAPPHKKLITPLDLKNMPSMVVMLDHIEPSNDWKKRSRISSIYRQQISIALQGRIRCKTLEPLTESYGKALSFKTLIPNSVPLLYTDPPHGSTVEYTPLESTLLMTVAARDKYWHGHHSEPRYCTLKRAEKSALLEKALRCIE